MEVPEQVARESALIEKKGRGGGGRWPGGCLRGGEGGLDFSSGPKFPPSKGWLTWLNWEVYDVTFPFHSGGLHSRRAKQGRFGSLAFTMKKGISGESAPVYWQGKQENVANSGCLRVS